MLSTLDPRRTRRLAAFLALPLVLVSTACDDDDDDDQPVGPTQTISQLAASTQNLSTLTSALQAANLVQTLNGAGPFTVFAPVNAGFAAIPQDQITRLLDPANRALLTKVLTYHVVPGRITAAQLTEGQTLTTVEGNTIRITLAGGARANGARIVTPDIQASNGVIHLVDAVLTENLDIVDVATLRGFTSLLQAATTANLVTTLRGNGAGQGITVFAPTNAAFAALGAGAPTDAATLSTVLQLHATNGRALAASLSNNQQITTLGGGTLTVGINGSNVTITGPENSAAVTATDVQARNGVIHVIDTVLLP